MPPPRGLLRPCRLSPSHPLGCQGLPGGRLMVSVRRERAFPVLAHHPHPSLGLVWMLSDSSQFTCVEWIEVEFSSSSTPIHTNTCGLMRIRLHSNKTLCMSMTICPLACRGFARFVNVRDEHGATPLHLAARQGRPQCVHHLLHAGAIVSAPTASYGFLGSTALHLAARRGNLDCVRELLAWGADRLHRDSAGRIAYAVALRRSHRACAALLNPAAAEPMVWPSPLKLISELNPEAKALLEAALMEANREREKQIIVNLKGGTTTKTKSSYSSSSAHDDDGTAVASRSQLDDDDDATELCGICLEQACSMEMQDCGHQMCAACTLALCCHSKPNPTTLALQPPACPFCRATITRLLVANNKTSNSSDEAALGGGVRSHSHGSSSFRGLTSAIRSLSLSRIGRRGSGRVADSDGICHGQASTPCGVNSLLPAQAIIQSFF